jgi:hypothetical protein
MNPFDSPPRELADFYRRSATLGTTERYRCATLAEAWYLSLQYEALLDWNAQAALHKKKPREIVPLYKTTIDHIQRFTWNGARFPRLTVQPTRTDDDEPDPDDVGPALTVDEAKQLETFVQAMIHAARLDRCAAEYTRNALITTSCAVVLGTRGGHIDYHVEPGKHCTPTFDPECPRHVQKLEIVYQTEAEESTGTLAIRRVMYWCRRVVDDQADTIYKPVVVRPGVTPDWVVDTEASVNHGLGFCPVVWVRTLPISQDAIDGQPVIDPSLYPMLSRINYIYSQMGRAIEYSLDPQWVRTNVSKASREELQRNPAKIWDIEDASPERKASLNLVEAKGSGPDAGRQHLADMRQRFLEAVGAVLSDPEKVSGQNVSGVVCEYIYAPMIALSSDLRKDLGDDAFCDLLNLALRICCAEVDKGKDVYIPGVNKAVKLIDEAQLSGDWLDFPLTLQWGKYFTPTAQDVQFAVAAANLAKQGGLVSKQTATRFVADYFAIGNVDAETEQIDEEQEEAAEKAADALAPPPPNVPTMNRPPRTPRGPRMPGGQPKPTPPSQTPDPKGGPQSKA